VNQISESDLSFQAALRTPPLTNLPSRQSFSRPAAATPCAQRPLDPNTTLTSFSQIACVHSRSLDLVQRVDFRDVSASDDQAFIDFERDMRLMLGGVKHDERMQIFF
jgi:hypothetical protein